MSSMRGARVRSRDGTDLQLTNILVACALPSARLPVCFGHRCTLPHGTANRLEQDA